MSLSKYSLIMVCIVLALQMLFSSGCEEKGSPEIFYDTLVHRDTVIFQDTVKYIDTVVVQDSVHILKHVGRLHFVESENSIGLYLRDQHITSYVFEDSIRKQVFFPVNLPSGRDFNRSYPVKRLPGETTDHPHHIGIWFTYGEVNEVDFWTTNWDNYDGVNARHGQIVHQGMNYEKISDTSAVFRTKSSWQNIDAQELLGEYSETLFTLTDKQMIIDRFTTLTAGEDVHFKDSKEGMYALRVAKELREDQTGRYRNSEGLETEQNVWGKQARWMILEGKMDSTNVSVLFIDHPNNVGYPAHWMARGYGLFSVNPLGREAFTNGAESLNFSMVKGESVTFKYRIVLSERIIDDLEIEGLFDEFSGK